LHIGHSFPKITWTLVVIKNQPVKNIFILHANLAQLAEHFIRNERVTFSPKAMLHVNGDFILGEAGSVLSKILKISLSKNIATVVANATNTETFSVAGAVTGSTVYISPDTALPDGLLIAYARVSAANTIEVKFTNITAQSINVPSIIYHITAIK
jgi:hypothetical protein